MLLSLLFGCKKKKFEFNIPEIYNTGILLSHKITSFSDTVIAYNIDLLTLQANDEKSIKGIPQDEAYQLGRIIELDSINDSELRTSGHCAYCTYTYEVSKENLNLNQTYCSFLLFDVTRSLSHSLISANSYIHSLDNKSYAQIGAYSRNGKLESDTLTIYNNFTNIWSEEIAEELFSLSGKSGGSSCLLDALYPLIEHIDTNGPSENKNIVVYTMDADDNKSSYTAEEIINYANEKNVKLNFIVYDIDKNMLKYNLYSELSNKTDGFYLYCQDSRKRNVAFLSLSKVLKGNYNYFRISVNQISSGLLNRYKNGEMEIISIDRDSYNYDFKDNINAHIYTNQYYE